MSESEGSHFGPDFLEAGGMELRLWTYFLQVQDSTFAEAVDFFAAEEVPADEIKRTLEQMESSMDYRLEKNPENHVYRPYKNFPFN